MSSRNTTLSSRAAPLTHIHHHSTHSHSPYPCHAFTHSAVAKVTGPKLATAAVTLGYVLLWWVVVC